MTKNMFKSCSKLVIYFLKIFKQAIKADNPVVSITFYKAIISQYRLESVGKSHHIGWFRRLVAILIGTNIPQIMLRLGDDVQGVLQ